MTLDKSWKLEVESFAKLCWPVLWTEQALTEFDGFEMFNADATDETKICHNKICPLILDNSSLVR